MEGIYMTIDINDLNLVAEPEQVAPEEYVPPFTLISNDPLDKGIYIGKFIDGGFNVEGKKKPYRLGTVHSKKNDKNYRSVEVAFEVEDAKINGKNVGTRRVWGRVNTMPESLIFREVRKGRENANGFMDMLRAGGYTGALASNDDYENALLTTIEDEAQVKLKVDKSAYCNPKSNDYPGCGNTVRGEDSFIGVDTSEGTTDVGLRVLCPGDHTEATRPILLAKNEVKAYYPFKK